MHFGDSIFIFILALVLVGPKKLPEVARQVGKLLAEFRRASNEFKFQIQEEMRQMEEDERRKKLEESRAATATAAKSEEITPPPEIVAQTPTPLEESTPTIQPPSVGETVSTGRPFATPAEEPLPLSPELALNSADLVEEATTPDAVHSNGNHPVAGDLSEHESVHHD